MKKIIITIILTATLLAANVYAQMALTWDPYSDSIATGLKIQSSTDSVNWSTLINNIPTDAIAVAVPTHSVENERVYYRMIAFNQTAESDPSNVVSYLWTTGGGGQIRLQTPEMIRFIDCSNPQTGEEQICQDLGL